MCRFARGDLGLGSFLELRGVGRSFLGQGVVHEPIDHGAISSPLQRDLVPSRHDEADDLQRVPLPMASRFLAVLFLALQEGLLPRHFLLISLGEPSLGLQAADGTVTVQLSTTRSHTAAVCRDGRLPWDPMGESTDAN